MESSLTPWVPQWNCWENPRRTDPKSQPIPGITPHLEGLPVRSCRHPKSEFHPISPSPGPTHVIGPGPTGAHTAHGRHSLPSLGRWTWKQGQDHGGAGNGRAETQCTVWKKEVQAPHGPSLGPQLYPVERTTSKRMSRGWFTSLSPPDIPRAQPKVPPSVCGSFWSHELPPPNILTWQPSNWRGAAWSQNCLPARPQKHTTKSKHHTLPHMDGQAIGDRPMSHGVSPSGSYPPPPPQEHWFIKVCFQYYYF